MSKDIEVTIHGWVAASPYLSNKEKGTVGFASLPIIHTERYRDATGEWHSGRSLTLRAKAWGALANNIAGSIDKGQPVIATGRLSMEQWEDSEGNTRSDLVLRLTSIGHDLNFGAAGFHRVRPNTTGEANPPTSETPVVNTQEHPAEAGTETSVDALTDSPFGDPDAAEYTLTDSAALVAV